MIDLTALSKHKHLYHIYEDSIGELHCTKYPIIYLNSKVVYFKDARKQEYISYVKLCNIYDDFEACIKRIDYYGTFNYYFWNIDDNINDLFKEFKQQRKAQKLLGKEKQIIDRYNRAKREFEMAQKELDKFNIVKGEPQ